MEHKALWALRFLNFDPSLAGEKRKIELVQLDEMREGAYHSNRKYKAKVKVSHDKKIKHKEFRPGQSVLLFNSRMRLFPGKLKTKWSGPFLIKEVKDYGAIVLQDLEGTKEWTVNGQRLKWYVGGELSRDVAESSFDDP